MANLNFNAANVPPASANIVVPAGWYNVIIEHSEVVPTAAGTGTILKLRYSIVDGEFKGRKIFGQLNIVNPSPMAQEIAQKQLSAICHAVNVIQCNDSQQLHNIPFKVKLKITPGGTKDQHTGEKYDDKNEVTGWEKSSTNVGVSGGSAPGATPPVTAKPITPPPVATAPVAAPPAWGAPAGQQPWQAPKPAEATASVAAPVTLPPLSAPVAEVPQQPPVAAPIAAQAPVAEAADVPPWVQQ